MAERSRSKSTGDLRIANERIEILFSEADKRAKRKQYELSDRYVKLARRIAMRYNIKLSKDLKRRFCKYCYAYLSPSRRTDRTDKGIKKIKCLKCGRIMRIPW
ncbi:MAG: hypothetical protein ABIG30_00675 [Candidatus Aenigmatarchaeota archaeon]